MCLSVIDEAARRYEPIASVGPVLGRTRCCCRSLEHRGCPQRPDTEVLGYARDNGLVVFTHDLDFGVLLALTRRAGPSVLQVRTQNVMPEDIGTIVLDSLARFADALSNGALVTVDHAQVRARVLPLR